MMRDRIIYQIQNGIAEINEIYRRGPSLYFYRRIIEVWNERNDLNIFFQDNYNFELLYAVLVSWDMNSRGAKLKDFEDFRANILSCREILGALDDLANQGNYQFAQVAEPLQEAYGSLSIMVTNGRLVSNSKLLHFLFPNMLMPMDRKNTLKLFYGSTHESMCRYFEIIKLSFEIMACPLEWGNYIDTEWNATKPKIIDNAILMLEK